GVFLPHASDETISWGNRQKVLLEKYVEALQRGAYEIVLQPHDIEKMASQNPLPLPGTFSIVATVAASSEKPAPGDFRIFLKNAYGPSGARLFGRFCHADETLRACVRQHLRSEESLRPDSVFAEIV